MIRKILKKANNFFLKRDLKKREDNLLKIKKDFFNNGQIPWSDGYIPHKKDSIIQYISDDDFLNELSENRIQSNFGYRLDERVIEYPWIFSNLKKEATKFLDAGSTFNFEYLLNHKYIAIKEKYIYTYYPEKKSFNNKRVSYVYGDLRELPFKNDFFEEIVCQSTIEHIDMDNSMYGYDLESTLDVTSEKSYEYLKVVNELIRVLNSNGQLLLTFPFGKFENHGFFQQFDNEMVDKITDRMKEFGNFDITYFKYLPNGWEFSTRDNCSDSESFNPHTLKGKKDDFAAHSRAICCLKFTKS